MESQWRDLLTLIQEYQDIGYSAEEARKMARTDKEEERRIEKPKQDE